jgi:outer membrane protein assembly factor BamB
LKIVGRNFYTLVFVVTLSHPVFAAPCLDGTPETVIFYVNGIDNDPRKALESTVKLSRKVRDFIAENPLQAGCLQSVRLAYNHNELLFLDLFESARQILSEEEIPLFWRILSRLVPAPVLLLPIFTDAILSIDLISYVIDDDLQEHVRQYQAEITERGRKIVAVAHSQGNLYANQAYHFLSSSERNNFSIVAVATPADRVAGSVPGVEPYTTLEEDFIHFIPGALSPNTSNNEDCGSSWDCHAFVNSYLNGSVSGPQILSDIVAAISTFPPENEPTANSWPMFQHDAYHTGRSPVPGPQDATRQWEFVFDNVTPDFGFLQIPVVDRDGTIYIGSGTQGSGNLYAITPVGSLKWKSPPLEAAPTTPAIGLDGTIYVGTEDFGQTLYALNPLDGSIRGTFAIGERSDFVTGAADGTLYVGAENGFLFALNPDLTERWRVLLGTIDVTGRPATVGSDGTIYFTHARQLQAFHPGGTLKWVASLNAFSVDPGIATLSAASIAPNDTIYAGFADRLAAFAPDGSRVWDAIIDFSMCGLSGLLRGPSIAAIAPDGGIVVGFTSSSITAGSGVIQAFNPDGTTRWTFCPITFAETFQSAPVIDADGTVYFTTHNGQSGDAAMSTLYALNPDGSLKWSAPLGSFVGGGLAIGPSGSLYLTAFDLQGFKLIALGIPIPP